MARNTKSPKKAASSQSSPKKTPTQTSANASSSTQAAAQPTAASTRRAPEQTTSLPTTGWRFKFMMLCIPLTQMLWNAEAPLRPFSAVREPSTGLPVPELIDPKILLVTAEPSDLVYFTPTVGLLLDEPRKSKSELYSVTFGSNDDAEMRGWENAWDVLGLEPGRREVMELPRGESLSSHHIVESHIKAYILEHNIDTILTYDNTTGNEKHLAILHGLSSLLASPTLTPKLQTPEGSSYAPRIITLRTNPPTRNFSILSPIIEHILLVYRAMTFDAVKAKAEGLYVSTFFVSDIRKYVKSWRVVLCFPSQSGPLELAMWALSRGLWVNEWVEI